MKVNLENFNDFCLLSHNLDFSLLIDHKLKCAEVAVLEGTSVDLLIIITADIWISPFLSALFNERSSHASHYSHAIDN